MTGTYTCNRLVEEARKKDIKLEIVGVHDCILTKEGVINCSIHLEEKDFIINRYKWGAIKDALNCLAKRAYNKIECSDTFKNKYLQVKNLRSEFFSIPKYALGSFSTPFSFIENQIGAPFVAKALESSRGNEVYLIENESDFQYLRNKHEIDREWLFEEFISESKGRDLRLICIRGEAVACMQRSSNGDFRANVALGASVSKVEITPHLQNIARDIWQQTDLDIIGIDLLFGKEGYYLCEINVMPGLQGIEKASGINVAAKIMKMIEQDLACQ